MSCEEGYYAGCRHKAVKMLNSDDAILITYIYSTTIGTALIRNYMKSYLLLLLAILLSNFTISNDVQADEIKDDVDICMSVELGKFKSLIKELKLRYNKTLEDAYFDISCQGNDLLGMVVDKPMTLYLFSIGIKKYFEKDIKKPKLFSRALLNNIDTRDILKRIDFKLMLVKGDPQLSSTAFEKRLIKMKNKYTTYLKKYPVD